MRADCEQVGRRTGGCGNGPRGNQEKLGGTSRICATDGVRVMGSLCHAVTHSRQLRKIVCHYGSDVSARCVDELMNLKRWRAAARRGSDV